MKREESNSLLDIMAKEAGGKGDGGYLPGRAPVLKTGWRGSILEGKLVGISKRRPARR